MRMIGYLLGFFHCYYPRHNGWPNGCSFFALKGLPIRPIIVARVVWSGVTYSMFVECGNTLLSYYHCLSLSLSLSFSLPIRWWSLMGPHPILISSERRWFLGLGSQSFFLPRRSSTSLRHVYLSLAKKLGVTAITGIFCEQITGHVFKQNVFNRGISMLKCQCLSDRQNVLKEHCSSVYLSRLCFVQCYWGNHWGKNRVSGRQDNLYFQRGEFHFNLNLQLAKIDRVFFSPFPVDSTNACSPTEKPQPSFRRDMQIKQRFAV